MVHRTWAFLFHVRCSDEENHPSLVLLVGPSSFGLLLLVMVLGCDDVVETDHHVLPREERVDHDCFADDDVDGDADYLKTVDCWVEGDS